MKYTIITTTTQRHTATIDAITTPAESIKNVDYNAIHINNVKLNIVITLQSITKEKNNSEPIIIQNNYLIN